MKSTGYFICLLNNNLIFNENISRNILSILISYTFFGCECSSSIWLSQFQRIIPSIVHIYYDCFKLFLLCSKLTLTFWCSYTCIYVCLMEVCLSSGCELRLAFTAFLKSCYYGFDSEVAADWRDHLENRINSTSLKAYLSLP